jgi:hypothetical protein|tara:strand:- start:6 stop:311 length:306 start_codon:yes stop_codon:yes gene_type:complete
MHNMHMHMHMHMPRTLMHIRTCTFACPACIHARRVACRATGKANIVAGSAGSSVQGLAELLTSLNLTQHLGAADAWCVDLGAEGVADLKDEDFAEQLAEVL